LRVLGRGYLALSKWTNGKLLIQEKAFPALTAKFNTRLAMAESVLLLEQPDEALKILASESGFDVERLRARALAQKGKNKEALANLKRMIPSTRSASQKRDLAETFTQIGEGIDQGLILISDALRDKPSSPYHRAHANLLLADGKPDLAIKAFARGYKIENRNRIDQIDPEYMCDYSHALYDNYKLRYEEIVETLYHLQKEFPAARSMYYAMQGISAGMARNYDANPIFRKGG
jgi:tetratricopeptide (TPR) repeat protein